LATFGDGGPGVLILRRDVDLTINSCSTYVIVDVGKTLLSKIARETPASYLLVHLQRNRLLSLLLVQEISQLNEVRFVKLVFMVLLDRKVKFLGLRYRIFLGRHMSPLSFGETGGAAYIAEFLRPNRSTQSRLACAVDGE